MDAENPNLVCYQNVKNDTKAMVFSTKFPLLIKRKNEEIYDGLSSITPFYKNGKMKEAYTLAKNLWNVDGIIYVHITQYEIFVRLADMYYWNQMRSEIFKIIKDYVDERIKMKKIIDRILSLEYKPK